MFGIYMQKKNKRKMYFENDYKWTYYNINEINRSVPMKRKVIKPSL